MELNKTDYVLKRTSDGGYYTWPIVSTQHSTCGDSPEEAVTDLGQTMEDMVEEIYLVEDLV